MSRSQSLEQGLARKVPISSGLEPFHPQSIARRTSSTLLFYWVGPVHSWLWVVTPARTFLVTLPPSQEIDPLVKSYRDSFTDARDPLEAGNIDGKKLYATLLQPAEKFLPKNSRVIVLPDGSLNSLNFETPVVTLPRPHYWIDDVTLSIANSLSLLNRSSIRSSQPAGASLLLVGDALSANPDFPQLPEAAREVALLEKYFPANDRVSLTGKSATPKSGQDPATALCNAKLTLVNSTSIYRKPFYWAPFLLYSGT